MEKFFLYILLLLCVLKPASAAMPVFEDGLYVIDPAGEVKAQDLNGAPLVLGGRLADKIDRALLKSISNDNTEYFLSLERKDAFSKDYPALALCLAAQCIAFNSGGKADVHTIGAQFVSAEFAEKIAAHFRIKPRLRRHPKHEFFVRFMPAKPGFAATEPLMVTLEVTNLGKAPVTFQLGGQNRGERDNQFGFTAYDGHKAVPDTGSPVHFGGLSTRMELQPGGKLQKEVDLTKWFAFSKPGVYQLTGTYALDFVDSSDTDWFTIWHDYAAAPFTLTIQ